MIKKIVLTVIALIIISALLTLKITNSEVVLGEGNRTVDNTPAAFDPIFVKDNLIVISAKIDLADIIISETRLIDLMKSQKLATDEFLTSNTAILTDFTGEAYTSSKDHNNFRATIKSGIITRLDERSKL
jgi:hypothetical protein